MGIIKSDDIIAYGIDDDIVCRRCLTNDDRIDLKEGDVIKKNDHSADLVFCDRCMDEVTPH